MCVCVRACEHPMHVCQLPIDRQNRWVFRLGHSIFCSRHLTIVMGLRLGFLHMNVYGWVCVYVSILYTHPNERWERGHIGERSRPLNPTTYQLPIHFLSRRCCYASLCALHIIRYTVRASILAISNRFYFFFNWHPSDRLLLLLWLLVCCIHFNNVCYFLWISSTPAFSLLLLLLFVFPFALCSTVFPYSLAY